MASISGELSPSPTTLSTAIAGDTLRVLWCHGHPTPTSQGGEGELFIGVSQAGPAPTMPTAQSHETRTCPPRVEAV